MPEVTVSYLRTYLVPVCLYAGPCQRSLGVVTPGEVSTSDQDTRSTSWRCGVDEDAKHEDIGGAIEDDGTGYFNDHQTRLYKNHIKATKKKKDFRSVGDDENLK